MKRISLVFLQFVVVLTAIVALLVLIRLPMTEGRAKDLDLFSIYSDPFILYGYASSIAFFVALYNAFRLLGHIKHNRLFSNASVRLLRNMRYCTILLSVLIVVAGTLVRIFHHEDDDPAGFIGMCIVMTFVFITVSTALAVLEKLLQNAVDMKKENDLTI